MKKNLYEKELQERESNKIEVKGRLTFIKKKC